MSLALHVSISLTHFCKYSGTGIGYVRPFFGGMPALSSVSWSRPLAIMLKLQKRGLRMTADSTSNLGNHPGLSLGAIRRR